MREREWVIDIVGEKESGRLRVRERERCNERVWESELSI